MKAEVQYTNAAGDEYHVTGWESCEEIKTDKKANVRYWDGLEGAVEDFLKKMTKDAGIEILSFGDDDLVKKVTEFIANQIEDRFPEANFPYVDQDF